MGGRRRAGAAHLFAAVVLLALPASPASAQSAVELSPSVRGSLLTLQERWSQWLAAYYQGDPERAREVTTALVAATQRLGMQALPDLSRAAVVRAATATREGDLVRARLALETAERLDPGRPETAFAEARLARREGRWMASARAWGAGWVRTAGLPLERRLVLYGASLFAVYVLLLAGGLFVAALMAVRGPRLFRQLSAWTGRRLSAPMAVAAAALVLFWPVVLPAGPAWLVLYWSVLLWAGASPRQRGVLLGLWVFLAGVPWVVTAERERLAVDLSPPSRAVDDVLRGRLQGGLFSDLGVLPALLPEEPAVTHLMADLSRRLGQWDRARQLYQRVLEQEPDNAPALVDLGTYYFDRGDYGGAVRLFRGAVEADPTFALGWFDLSQAYSKQYLFGDVRQAIARAHELTSSGLEVSRWMAASGEGGVIAADGGLARADEVRRKLAASWQPAGGQGGRVLSRLREVRSFGIAFGALAAALALQLVRRRTASDLAEDEEADEEPGAGLVASPWRRALLPGVPSMVAGRGLRAYLALVPPAFLVLLPGADTLAFELPLGNYGGPVAGVTCAAGTALWLFLRAALARRGT